MKGHDASPAVAAAAKKRPAEDSPQGAPRYKWADRRSLTIESLTPVANDVVEVADESQLEHAGDNAESTTTEKKSRRRKTEKSQKDNKEKKGKKEQKGQRAHLLTIRGCAAHK